MSTTLEDCETLIEEYEPEENRINAYLSLQGKKNVSCVKYRDVEVSGPGYHTCVLGCILGPIADTEAQNK